MTANGKLYPFTIDTESTPSIVVRPVPQSWSFIERTGVLHQEQGIGSYVEIATSAALKSVSMPTLKAKSNFVWFKLQQVKTLGDGLVTIRGRIRDDTGTREATPTDYQFDLTGAEVGDVFVSPARMSDNAGIMVSGSGGFDGVIDYGTVSPWNLGGGMRYLWGAEISFEPIEQVVESWIVAWGIKRFKAGTAGGVSDLLASRTYRQNDTPFKAAEHGLPGHDHHYTLSQAFSGDANEGIIFSVGLKAASATLTLYVS